MQSAGKSCNTAADPFSRGEVSTVAALILSSEITSSASEVGGIFVWWYCPLGASVQAPLKWEDARGIEKLRRQCFEWRGFNNHCSIGSWYRLNLQSCMYTPRLAIDRCKDLCLRATNRQTEDKKWSSANFARTDHALPGFALARLHLSWIFIVGQLCTNDPSPPILFCQHCFDQIWGDGRWTTFKGGKYPISEGSSCLDCAHVLCLKRDQAGQRWSWVLRPTTPCLSCNPAPRGTI